MVRIHAGSLSVIFPLYHVGSRSLKKRLLAKSPLRLRTDAHDRVVVAALKDLNFRIEAGERVALIGRNGAGKTTLLRTLAGVFEPVGGRLEVAGEVGALIDPGAGLDPDATGRENIELRALFRGMDRAAALALAEEVGAFSGLAEFLDVPMRSYSAGMALRLSFALATAMRPQILLMDEWISAGDADFRLRANKRLEQVVRGAEILVLATHDEATARLWCTRGMVLEEGRIVADGPLAEVLAR